MAEVVCIRFCCVICLGPLDEPGMGETHPAATSVAKAVLQSNLEEAVMASPGVDPSMVEPVSLHLPIRRVKSQQCHPLVITGVALHRPAAPRGGQTSCPSRGSRAMAHPGGAFDQTCPE